MKTFRKVLVLLCVLNLIFSAVFPASAAEMDEKDPVLTTRNDFVWGLNMHHNFYAVYGTDKLEEQIHLAAEMGCTILRNNFNVNDLYHMDLFVKLCNAYDIQVMLTYTQGNIREGSFGKNDHDMFKMIADRYNGKNGHGKIDYIQIDNELDLYFAQLVKNYGGSFLDGDSVDLYPIKDLERVCNNVKSACTAIREADSDVRIIINAGWKHYGMFTYFVEQGVDFDVIGWDWYTNQADDFVDGEFVFGVYDALTSQFNKPIMICETNIWNDAPVDETDPATWDSLVELCEDYYSKPNVIGCIFYQMCDQLNFETGDSYNREAHFGFIYADKYGNMTGKKAAYDRFQHICGGVTQPMVTKDQIISQTDKYDLNADGAIDVRDLVHLKKAIAEEKPIEYADFDDSGEVDSEDVSYLKQYLLGLIESPDPSTPDDPLTPPAMPTEYKTILPLDGNFDFTGNFSGGYSSNTKKTFTTFDLSKYENLEFDVYFNGDDSGWIRFYFLDESFSGAVSGRGCYDISVTPGEWTHVQIEPDQFNTGYGMDGDVTKMCGTLFERMDGGNSSERIIVANMCATSNTPIPPAMPTDHITVLPLEGNVDFTGNFSGGYSSNTKKTFTTFDLSKYENLEFDVYFDGDDSGWIRFYFLDESFSGATSGRGIYDISVTPGEWTHVQIEPDQFNIGYGMDGDVTKMCGILFERMDGGSSSERIIVANMCATADYVVEPSEPEPDNPQDDPTTPPAMPTGYETILPLDGNFDFTGNYAGNNAYNTQKTFSTVNLNDYDYLEFDFYFVGDDDGFNRFYFLDDAGERGVYDVWADSGKWTHVKIAPDEFIAGGAYGIFNGDMSRMSGIMFEYMQGSAANRIIVANMCATANAVTD